MRSRLVVSLAIAGLLLISLRPVFGQSDETTSPTSVDADRVAALVAQLESGARAERDAAEQTLADLGRDVLPLLPSPNRRMAAETLQRLERIRRQLETANAEAAIAESRLTLNLQEATLEEAFAAIEEQTGNKIVDYRRRFDQEAVSTPVSLQCADAPYWEVVDQLLDQAGVTLYDYPADRGSAAVVARGEGMADRAGRAAYSGAFRLEPLRMEAIRDLRNPAADQLKTTFHLMWEPRLTPVALTADLTKFSATTDDGASLAAVGAPRLDVGISPEFASVEFDLPLELPPRSATRIDEISGEFQAIVLGPPVTLEFERLASARNVRQARGDVAVTLMQVQRVNSETWRLFMQVEFNETSGALESHQTWVYNNLAVLVDAEGNETTPGATDAAGAGPNSVALSYIYVIGDNIDDYRFRYQTPVSVERIDISASIEGLELP